MEKKRKEKEDRGGERGERDGRKGRKGKRPAWDLFARTTRYKFTDRRL